MRTLVLTDAATAWTECAPLLVREQNVLSGVLRELRKLLPFNLLGLDTDNDSVFMNETVHDYCQATGVVCTHCRPYRKNDQAFVERMALWFAYCRLEALEAATALVQLYAAVRPFVNFFQSSFKLAEKGAGAQALSSSSTPLSTAARRSKDLARG
jgi:hypothetical protein